MSQGEGGGCENGRAGVLFTGIGKGERALICCSVFAFETSTWRRPAGSWHPHGVTQQEAGSVNSSGSSGVSVRWAEISGTELRILRVSGRMGWSVASCNSGRWRWRTPRKSHWPGAQVPRVVSADAVTGAQWECAGRDRRSLGTGTSGSLTGRWLGCETSVLKKPSVN